MTLAPIPVCRSFKPGHHLHWIQWKLSRTIDPVSAQLIRIDAGRLFMATEDDRVLRWWNHDPDRVTAYAGPEDGRVLLYPRFHAMKIGVAWFNCDTSGIRTRCRKSR